MLLNELIETIKLLQIIYQTVFLHLYVKCRTVRPAIASSAITGFIQETGVAIVNLRVIGLLLQLETHRVMSLGDFS